MNRPYSYQQSPRSLLRQMAANKQLRLVSEDKTCHTGPMTNTAIPNDTLWGSTPDAVWATGPTPAEVHDDTPEARGMEPIAFDEPVEPWNNAEGRATFVLVPEGTEAYWEGYGHGCGMQLVDGRRYRIVATKRLGSTGRSDAQYIIDRLASGLYFAKLQSEVGR